MNTRNSNDFSKCKVGDKLWFYPLDCEVTVTTNNHPEYIDVIDTVRRGGQYRVVKTTGIMPRGHIQVLYFGKPQVIAPPEPPRLPDYKPGQWIAVWDTGNYKPTISKFRGFAVNGRVTTEGALFWDHHCSLEELPAVLEKWGEK